MTPLSLLQGGIFHTDIIRLKFSGTRELAQNMNRSCAILPMQHKKVSANKSNTKLSEKNIDGLKTRLPRKDESNNGDGILLIMLDERILKLLTYNLFGSKSK